MTKSILIGIDGGGTKTKCRVEDDQGNLIGESRAGPAQIRVSVDQAWHSIHQGIKEALAHTDIRVNDPSYHFYVGLGLAGTEFKNCRDQFLSYPHSFKKLALNSDAYAACLGAHNGNDGAIIIIGTGTKGLQIEQQQTAEVAGWGFPQDDVGAGAWLGLQTVHMTLRAVDGREEMNPFAQAVLDHFKGLNYLLDWSKDATSTRYASLAPLVIQYAQQDNPIAVKIMNDAAIAIDEIGAALDNKRLQPQKTMPCSLFGGLASFIAPLLGENLKKRLQPRQQGPAKGAILMIRQALKQEGISID